MSLNFTCRCNKGNFVMFSLSDMCLGDPLCYSKFKIGMNLLAQQYNGTCITKILPTQ